MPINNDSVPLVTLKEQIKILREHMQRLWDEKGCTDAEVLKVSIDLDHLLNKYQRKKGKIDI